MIYHEFINQLIPSLCFLHLPVDKTMHDTDATVNAECHGNLLIKHIKIKAILLIAELCYANYVFILPNWEAQDVPLKQTQRNIFTLLVVIVSYLQCILQTLKKDSFNQYQ
jgi:hypothetical protein